MARLGERPSRERGKREGGLDFYPQKAAPRPTVRSKTFGRISDRLQHAPPTPRGWEGGRDAAGGRGRGGGGQGAG